MEANALTTTLDHQAKAEIDAAMLAYLVWDGLYFVCVLIQVPQCLLRALAATTTAHDEDLL